MNEEIKLIEEEARVYVSDELVKNGFNNFHGTECVEEAFIAGASFILSKWQEANKWIKFASDDLPEIGKQIVCKSSSGRYHLANPISHDGIHWLAENFTEWKPIE